jgi:hypothetical protein
MAREGSASVPWRNYGDNFQRRLKGWIAAIDRERIEVTRVPLGFFQKKS